MKSSLKKKLATAIVAGCSVVALSSISFAADADVNNTKLPVAPYHQMNADFDKATIPAAVLQDSKAVYEKYTQQFKADYKWTDNACKRAAMSFVAIDKAYANQKITTQQAESLKQEILAFYKGNNKYYEKLAKLSGDDAKAYAEKNADKLFLNKNFAKIAKATNIPEETVAEVFKPTHHRNPNIGDVQQRATAFMGQLVKQQKITSDEANSILKYMGDAHEKIAKMSEQERSDYIKEHKDMTPQQRLDEMSQATGISSDRLQQIFTVMKEELKAQIAANKAVQEQQAK